MPVSSSAKKALRKDRRREQINLKIRRQVKMAIKAVRKKPSRKTLNLAFSWLDKAVKKNVFKKNKAARLKSRLSKLLKKRNFDKFPNKHLY
jgi:small subunit ribosomal protein S20